MDVRDLSLYYFTLVARNLSISSTAKSLFISQQALSKHIMRLESDFGVTLFERSPHLRLTPDGERVLVYAERVLAEERAMRNSLNEAHQSSLRFPIGLVTDSADILITPLIDRCAIVRPDIRLSFINCTYTNTIDLMRQGRISASFGMLHAFSDIFVKVPVFTDELFLVMKSTTFEQMPEKNQTLLFQNAVSGLTLTNISQCGVPLIIPWSGSRIGSYLINEFHRLNESPTIFAETWYFDEMFPICNSKYSASFAHSAQIYNHLSLCKYENYFIFPLKNIEEYYILGLVYHEDLANSPAMYDFIECVQSVKRDLAKLKGDTLQDYIKNQFTSLL